MIGSLERARCARSHVLRQVAVEDWRSLRSMYGLGCVPRKPQRLHALLHRGHVGEVLRQHAAPSGSSVGGDIPTRSSAPRPSGTARRRRPRRCTCRDRSRTAGRCSRARCSRRARSGSSGRSARRCRSCRHARDRRSARSTPRAASSRRAESSQCLSTLSAGSSFRQLVDQPERRIDQRLRRVGVRLLPGVDLHLRGRDARVGARAEPQLGLWFSSMPLGAS